MLNHSYFNLKPIDIHFIYGLANGNLCEACRLYAESFPNQRFPCRIVFLNFYRNLRDKLHLNSLRRPNRLFLQIYIKKSRTSFEGQGRRHKYQCQKNIALKPWFSKSLMWWILHYQHCKSIYKLLLPQPEGLLSLQKLVIQQFYC